jgi:hypothetical protein
MMWGTTPPCAKLTGDSGSGFEAALIGEYRLFCRDVGSWARSGHSNTLLGYPLPEVKLT